MRIGIHMSEEEKGFEAKIKSMYSGSTCACQTGTLEKKKSSLKTVTCRKCGKTFKTNRDADLCWKCEKSKNNP
jgi:Zn finger protein HypA/HybF involved in hydrogenase expression